MRATDLPHKAAYARAWRTLRTLPADQPVKHPHWTRGTVTAAEMRAEMRRALDRRINSRAGNHAANDPIPVELLRDSWALDDILQRRIRVYQFNTAKMRQRFWHLLSSHND